MWRQNMDYLKITWTEFFSMITLAIIIYGAEGGPALSCFLEVQNGTKKSEITVIKPMKSPDRVNRLFVKETVTFRCIPSTHQTNERCYFTWNYNGFTGPILSNFSVSDGDSVMCTVTCGSSRCSISSTLDVVKPSCISTLPSGTGRMTTNSNQNKEDMKFAFLRPYPVNFFTYNRSMKSQTTPALFSTSDSYNARNADLNIEVILCLFGVILVILSFFVGNATFLLAKCRSNVPNPNHVNHNGKQDCTSIDNEVLEQRKPISSLYEIPCNKPQSIIVPTNSAKHFPQRRTQSHYDKNILSVNSSKMKEVSLPPVPANERRRKKSLSDGCIYDRTSHFFTASCVGNMPIQYYEYNELPYTSQNPPRVLYNYPYEIAKSQYADYIYNDSTACRARLDSEFTYGRDRFLSNALKIRSTYIRERPAYITRKKRSSSQFSYQRDRFLSNAIKNAGGRRRYTESLYRRRSTRLGTMNSVFSLKRRGTRCFSKLSLSTLGDVFMDEHVYETISLDDFSKISSNSSLLLGCNHKSLNDVGEFCPGYDKVETALSDQRKYQNNLNIPRERGTKLPPFYNTLEPVFNHERRYSLPNPSKAIWV